MSKIQKINKVTLDLTLTCDCGAEVHFKEDSTAEDNKGIGICPNCKHQYAIVLAPKRIRPAIRDGKKHLDDFFKSTHGNYV